MTSDPNLIQTSEVERGSSTLPPMATQSKSTWSSALDRTSLVSDAVFRLKNPEAVNESQHVPKPNNNVLAFRPVDPPPETETNAQRPPLQGADEKFQRWKLKQDETRAKLQSEKPSTSLQKETPEDMLLRLSNEFQPIVEPNWDTVIYIGPPPQEHQQDDHEYEYVKQHFSKPYLLNSQTLRALDSKLFTKLLGPMSARAKRKLKKIGVHRSLPPSAQPKFYIDLRPMQDDDEALLMITELTCTTGVLSWHLSHLASGVPKTLINGKDDLNITSKPYTKSWIEAEEPENQTDFVDNVDMMDIDKPNENITSGEILDLEPEYSTIRHYTAIERLLHAIVGNDPKLNSAAKVWTFFSIAKFFDCAKTSKITAWIFDWLFTGNNSNFVQANPEVAYRMALGMQSLDILRTTFAMLVGERALMQAGSIDSDFVYRPGGRQVSAHGRMMSNLDDDEINRIDHAAHSLTRRINNLFHKLTMPPLQWVARSPEMIKFNALRLACKLKNIVDEPRDMLLDYVRMEIFQVLSLNVSEGDLMRLYRTKAVREFGFLKRSKSFADAYNAMPLSQRLLTQTFWSRLENFGIYQENEKSAAWSRGHSLAGLSELAPELDGEIKCIPKAILAYAVSNMNQRLKDRTLINQVPAWYAYDQSSSDDESDWPEPRDQYRYSRPPPATQELTHHLQELKEVEDSKIPLAYKLRTQGGNSELPVNYGKIIRKHGANASTRGISQANLLSEMTVELRSIIMREVLTPGYAGEAVGIESEISISQMDILLCLNDDEWKYLPLWAGGLDDGTGGVFADLDVPDMEQMEGFRGGKLGLGGISGGSESVDGSYTLAGDSEDFDEIMTDDGLTTVGKASRLATDGATSAGGSTVISLDE